MESSIIYLKMFNLFNDYYLKGNNKNNKEKTKGIVVKEVTIEEMVAEEEGMQPSDREAMASDAQALDKAEESDPMTVLASGCAAIAAAGLGAGFRIRRFFREV